MQQGARQAQLRTKEEAQLSFWQSGEPVRAVSQMCGTCLAFSKVHWM